jgi:hypothetical protein
MLRVIQIVFAIVARDSVGLNLDAPVRPLSGIIESTDL